METNSSRTVFVTGATGFIGAALVPALLRRGHRVRALARAGTLQRLPSGCEPVEGDALDSGSYAQQVAPADTLVHLIGVAHPAPWKANLFTDIDLASVRAMLAAARRASVRHIVYLSVAQPAPMMRAYVAARVEAERLICASGIPATFVRPWYVLGPGRRWPLLLSPVYRLLEAIPATRDSARRLGLVTRDQMIAALIHAIEQPARELRIVDVPAIRQYFGSLQKLV